jgi:hypothetical protein
MLDTLQLVPSLAQTLASYNLSPPPATLSMLSHYAGAAGLLFAVPTLATGIGELYGMWRGQVKRTETTTAVAKDAISATQNSAIAGQKLRTTLTHASLNDLVVGIAAYNWCVWSRHL